MGKVEKKFVAKQLLHFCIVNEKFYQKQIGARKNLSAIDVAALLIQKLQKAWKNQKIAKTLFMNVK